MFHYQVWKEPDAILKALHFFELELSVVPLSSTPAYAMHKKIPPLSHKRQVECMKIIPLSLRFIPAQRDVMHEKHRSIHELERKTKEKTTVK